VAGSNYEVNIKLDTKHAKTQLRELEERIARLNKMALSGKASRQAAQESREKLKLGNLELKNEVATLKVKEQELKVDRQSLLLERQKANIMNRGTGRKTGTAASRGGGKGGVLSGALISGAFPLLFGQGLLGGAAGFAGGAIGGAVGGQMGGFAGGLIATAGLTMLTNLKDGMVDLGNALSPANANIDQSIEKLKIINSSRAAEIKLIEQLEGKQAALAEITKETAKIVGNDGVRALREFAETMKLITGGMATQFLKIQAGLANILNKVFSFAGGDLTKAKSQLGSDNPLVQSLAQNRQAEANLDRNVTVDGFQTNFLMTEQGRAEAKRLEIDRKILENRIKVRAEKEAGMRIDKEIGVEHEQLKATTFAQFEMEQRILELRRTGLNPALAKQVSLFELSAKNVETGLENELESVSKILEAEKASSETYTDKIMLLEIRKQSLEDQLELNEKLLKSDKDRIIEAVKLREAQAKVDSLYASIASTVETGLVDAIEGAINGTKTLGDVARSVFAQIQRSLIQYGVNALLGGLFPGSKFFGGTRAAGGPVKGGKSYLVGERGPEMFSPGVSGMITPNHAMGGTTNVVVNVDASGSSVEGDEAQGRELGRLISVAVQSEIVQQQRPGGLLA
jgi:hypothetical protein